MVALTPFFLSTLLLTLSTPASSSAIAPKNPSTARRHHARLVQRALDSTPQAIGARHAKRADGTSCKIRPVYVNGTTVTRTGTTTATSTRVTSSSASTTSASSASTTPTALLAISLSAAAGLPPTTTAATSTYVAPTTSSAAPVSSATSVASAGFTPNGKKAGIAGGDSFSWMENHIGWWYDWSPAPQQKGTPIAVPMLWGDGSSSDSQDASRFAQFKSLTSTPPYVIGFEEPDCAGAGSANMPDPAVGAKVWESVQAPWKSKGSVMISPSMCKQADETWLTPFKNQISTPWDVTNVHINKKDMAGVRLDIDHYYNTYGKPLWVTEFACVDDANWIPCTDQSEINSFISQIVDLFEGDYRVAAYAYSDGIGLGSVWPTVSGGQLSASGQAYLSAISKYH